jgi:hypothetical protein
VFDFFFAEKTKIITANDIKATEAIAAIDAMALSPIKH